MSRKTARNAAMQLIFENLAGGQGGEETLQMVYEQMREEAIANDQEPTKKDRLYIATLLEGVLGSLDDLDDLIGSASRGWTVDRMPKVDLTIMRLGTWEILHRDENTPGAVIIHEAVELANQYGEEESGRFINGVLGTILRTQEDQDK